MDMNDMATHPSASNGYPTPSTIPEHEDSDFSGYSYVMPSEDNLPLDDGLSGQSTPAPKAEPPKKKRRAWGQPVPEFEKTLPPRKRAKTEAEKAQRAGERVLRNRKAADKSRQRQKAAVAKLELDNATLRQQLADNNQMIARNQRQLEAYRQAFGPIDFDFDFDFENDSKPCEASAAQQRGGPLDFQSTSTQKDVKSESSNAHQDLASVVQQHRNPFDFDYDPNASQDTQQPTLVPTAPIDPTRHSLMPFLTNPEKGSSVWDSSDVLAPASTSDMAHYPAAMMCGPQCQSEVSGSKLSRMLSRATSHPGLSQILHTLQLLTLYVTSSPTMATVPLAQVFQILDQRLRETSSEMLELSIMKNFHLIRSLISLPSTATRPAVFRLKLLSRLLACNPIMARLLLVATDRALQPVVGRSDFAEDCGRRWSWASLMTIKWSIIMLERVHRRMRRRGVTDLTECDGPIKQFMPGVDGATVVQNMNLWNSGVDSCNTTIITGQFCTEFQVKQNGPDSMVPLEVEVNSS
jgi:transcriptional activator HAC1